MITEDLNKENIERDVSLKEIIANVKKWIKFLLSKWLIIISISLMGGLIGLLFAVLKKPIYVATTTFVLEEDRNVGNMGALSGLASVAGFDFAGGGGLFQGENILELYKSRTMIEKSLLSPVDRSGKLIIDRYITFNNLKSLWKDKPDLLNLKFPVYGKEFLESRLVAPSREVRLRDSLLRLIIDDVSKNYLSVSKIDKKLSIIKVEVSSKDETFAKVFEDRLVENVNEFYIQTKTKKALNNVKILQQKTDSVRAVMNGAIYIAASVSDATPNLNPTRQVQRAAPIQRSQFSAETNKTILGTLVTNLEMSKISLQKETPLIQEIDHPVYPLESLKIGKRKATFIGLILGCFFVTVFVSLKKIYRENT